MTDREPTEPRAPLDSEQAYLRWKREVERARAATCAETRARHYSRARLYSELIGDTPGYGSAGSGGP